MAVIGIDPGQSGGAMVLHRDDGFPPSVYAFHRKDEFEILEALLGACDVVHTVFIEKVHGYPNQKRQFQFGRHVGFLIGVFRAKNIKVIEVSPQVWMAKLGLAGLSDEKKERKQLLRQAAEKLFPGVKVTLTNADALLIAEYGRRYQYEEI